MLIAPPQLKAIVRWHGRLGSGIVRVWCVRNLRGMAQGEQDARRGSVLDL